MKATGLGMTLEPQQIALQLDSETQLPLGVQSLRTTHSVEAEWKLHFPEVEPGLILAIATRPEVLNVLEMKLQTGIP